MPCKMMKADNGFSFTPQYNAIAKSSAGEVSDKVPGAIAVPVGGECLVPFVISADDGNH